MCDEVRATMKKAYIAQQQFSPFDMRTPVETIAPLVFEGCNLIRRFYAVKIKSSCSGDDEFLSHLLDLECRRQQTLDFSNPPSIDQNITYNNSVTSDSSDSDSDFSTANTSFLSPNIVTGERVRSHPGKSSAIPFSLVTRRDYFISGYPMNEQGGKEGDNRFESVREQEEQNEVQKPFRCGVCDATYHTKGSFVKHVKTHANFDMSLTCDLCEKCFTTKEERDKHVTTRTGKLFRCKTCKKAFCFKSALYKHGQTHKKGPVKVIEDVGVKCDLCPKAFPDEPSAKSHRMSQHSTCYYAQLANNSFSCVMCLKEVTGDRRKLHMFIHMRDVYECRVCKKGFMTKDHLIAHEKTHVQASQESREIPLKDCDICGESFADASTAKAHRMTKHYKYYFTQTEELKYKEKYSCTVCLKEILNDSRRCHMRIHARGLFRCRVCDKVCTTEEELASHEQSHVHVIE